jgi:hypothetical protein
MGELIDMAFDKKAYMAEYNKRYFPKYYAIPENREGILKNVGTRSKNPEVMEAHKVWLRDYRKTPEGKKAGREYRQKPEVKARKRQNSTTPKYREWRRRYEQEPTVAERRHLKRQQPEQRIKDNARLLAWTHISLEGKSCERCGATKNLERHHPDHSKPLETVILCRWPCHQIAEAEKKARETQKNEG